MNQDRSGFRMRRAGVGSSSRAVVAAAVPSSGLPSCIVAFPDAREGDIVVHIKANDWDGFSIEEKLKLSPFGRIDSIDRQHRVARVKWYPQEESNFFEKYSRPTIIGNGIWLVASVVDMMVSLPVGALWDKDRRNHFRCLAFRLFLLFYLALLLGPSVLTRLDEQYNDHRNQRSNQAQKYWTSAFIIVSPWICLVASIVVMSISVMVAFWDEAKGKYYGSLSSLLSVLGLLALVLGPSVLSRLEEEYRDRSQYHPLSAPTGNIAKDVTPDMDAETLLDCLLYISSPKEKKTQKKKSTF